VPEIDMPGHVSAILAAYPELSCTGKPMEVKTEAGIFPDILCAGKEEVFTFIENLLDDILPLFPYEYVHIGGDEAPKERWNECPCCQEKMRELGYTDPQQLQGYVENRIAALLHQRGKTPIVWNEAANGGNLDQNVIMQLWTQDKDHRVALHLSRGGKVILSEFFHCYCDYPYGMISLRDVYDFEMLPEELQDYPDGIIGTECLIWTEFVRDRKRLEEYCWPRFCASAEVGWSGRTRPGYEDFTGRLRTIFPIFAKYDILATPEVSWTPDGALRERQLREFAENYPAENRAGFLKRYGLE
jgi:hexosaminidase